MQYSGEGNNCTPESSCWLISESTVRQGYLAKAALPKQHYAESYRILYQSFDD